jgi:hypothetical protein
VIPFEGQTLFQNIVPSVSFPKVWWVGRMGNNNHVVSHKLCGFQGCVSRCIAVMEPVVVAPKFRSFSSHLFSQASQNITVKVRVDCSVRRTKFTVNNHLHIGKKQWACSLLNPGPAVTFLLLVIAGCSTATFVAFFLNNCKSNFCYPSWS